ncbi:MAG TPA: DUF5916 domain-containing protein, partial [Gemmatimonadaceae bacterium]|nr:DUF5916 domain-containing protein [Gemmatimonadaceae bacterium]
VARSVMAAPYYRRLRGSNDPIVTRAKPSRRITAIRVALVCAAAQAAWGAAVKAQDARARPGTPRPPLVHWVAGSPRLDGALDDPAWASADSITDFTQRDPREGVPATERTVVRFLGTPAGLFVGVWAYDREPGGIRRAQLRRDADLTTDDYVTLVLDSQRDRRSGYLFSVNPNGALHDAEVVTFEQENVQWDGIWDARARLTPDGWTAELFVPWATLRYRRGEGVWGMNLRRFIRRKNEEILWRAWGRSEGVRFLERAGALGGLGELPRRATVELRPYVLGTSSLPERTFLVGGRDSVTLGAGTEAKVGADAKLAVTSGLTLDLTVNTDFAQAEVDRQVVNLTRFPRFFPETRQFFLEGAGIFDFGRLQQTQLFYSRRIGLDSLGRTVPILGAARVTGRVGRQQVGLLALRTGGLEDATDLVARVKRDVLGRGFVGAMLTAQERTGRPLAPSVGADFNLPYIVRGQNLVFIGGAAVHRDSLDARPASYARFIIDYPNDHADIVARFDRVEAGFDPPLGFVLQRGIMRYAGQVALTPRPHRWGIRKLLFAVPSWDVVRALDGGLDNAFVEVRPLGALFESDDRVELNLQRRWDRPREAFEVFPGAVIPAGRYEYDRVELLLAGSPARVVSGEMTASAGRFYDGRSRELDAAVRVRHEPHVLTSFEFGIAGVRRPAGDFTAHTARVRLDVAASPRLGTTLFGQWDDESDRLALNARLRWTRSPGSDAYVVWNSAWPSELDAGRPIPWRQPVRGTLVVKYVQYARF